MTQAATQFPMQHVLRRVASFIGQAAHHRSQARRAEVFRVSSRVLARGASVHVLRWDGEELLVGCTDQSMVVLARRPVTAPPGERA